MLFRERLNVEPRYSVILCKNNIIHIHLLLCVINQVDGQERRLTRGYFHAEQHGVLPLSSTATRN